MIVDCDSCEVRGGACGDCVMGVLLGVPEVPARRPGVSVSPGAAPSGASQLQLDAAERRALEVLADQGLIPRLRVVPAGRATAARSSDGGAASSHVRDAG